MTDAPEAPAVPVRAPVPETRSVLGVGLLVGVLAALVGLFVSPIPTPSKELIASVIGGLMQKLGTVFDWYFGSAKGNGAAPAQTVA